MRTLKFIVNGLIVKPDPECDFEGIVPGSEGYLQAEFSFTQVWAGTIKVVGFWRNGVECPPQVLKDGKTCMIPSEALTSRRFSIQVLGKKGNTKLYTNKLTVCQNGR